jgi:hypothetical protein
MTSENYDESLTVDVRHKESKQTHNFLPDAAARCSIPSVTAERQRQASVSPSLSVKFKGLMVRSKGSGSGSSANLRALSSNFHKILEDVLQDMEV